jgi:hypothetical protein
MAHAIPQMGPGGSGTSSSGVSLATVSPSALPPAGATAAEYGSASGTATAIAAPATANVASDAAPTVQPVGEGVSAGVGAWNNSKKITGLWSINQNRNSWTFVDGLGWRKLANNSDSAIVALSVLAAHAREKNSTVNYRDEADGMIHEMYVW